MFNFPSYMLRTFQVATLYVFCLFCHFVVFDFAFEANFPSYMLRTFQVATLYVFCLFCHFVVFRFPVEFLQFIPSQNGCVRSGIVVEQNHISDWLTTPFVLVCGFHVVQKLAVLRSIHSTTFVKEVNDQYAFTVSKNGCENFSS